MRSPAGRPIAVLALAVVTTVAAGCSIGDIRRGSPPPDRSPAPAGSGPEIEQRRVRVPVPSDARLHQVEFVDADRGYALFVGPGADAAASRSSTPDPSGSGPPAASSLFTTSDGGLSWHPLSHPLPAAGYHELYAGHGLLVLFTELGGWFVSADAGRTFTHHGGTGEAPAAYHRSQGRFQVCCDGDDRPKVVEWAADRARPLPSQPPLPALATVGYGGGRLVAAELRDGRPYASVSGDQGRTWEAATAPASDGGLFMVRAQVAADGDGWLLGYVGDPTVFPKLWRQVGSQQAQGWLPCEVSNHPARFTSIVPLGGGLLAVTGPRGSGLIGEGRYTDVDWPVGDNSLRMLDDGTLFAAHPPSGEMWLGLGRGANRRWISLRLDRM